MDLSPVAGPRSASRLSRRHGRDPPRLARRELEEAIHDRGGTLWVDIENPDGNSTEQAETLLRDVFGFHPLAIEDALQESHIPKIDDWGDYLYIVFHGTSIDPADRRAAAPRARHLPRPELPGHLSHRAALVPGPGPQGDRARPARPAAARRRPPALPVPRARRGPVARGDRAPRRPGRRRSRTR